MSSDNKQEENKVKKIIPSKLENASYGVIYGTFGKIIPKNMTPNQMTMLGATFGFVGIICGCLAHFNRLFLIGTIVGLVAHLICDDLDGFIARKRNMSSDAGAFLDLLTDIIHITYLVIALAFAGVVKFQIAVFLVPVYALMMFTAMNYIRYLNEFLFPRLGPIETHMFFVMICVLGMIPSFGELVQIFGVWFGFTDIIFVLGGIAMYYEMIRLQITLFVRLSKKK
ncbi:CDP-alcohol phosphatidyltransferase family protein [Butyrivibrio proteoclasticus]|uniref:CDP-alcohol phosphatidyltransferase family protein n=1 Tax=Butyrivibrio proteoclasticus TaxID=43305 RepID=UPI0004792308|nr:CDP-alcohol phosphatidyltransferase family protein [Butyrivibrio proteoclasticus]